MVLVDYNNPDCNLNPNFRRKTASHIYIAECYYSKTAWLTCIACMFSLLGGPHCLSYWESADIFCLEWNSPATPTHLKRKYHFGDSTGDWSNYLQPMGAKTHNKTSITIIALAIELKPMLVALYFSERSDWGLDGVGGRSGRTGLWVWSTHCCNHLSCNCGY